MMYERRDTLDCDLPLMIGSPNLCIVIVAVTEKMINVRTTDIKGLAETWSCSLAERRLTRTELRDGAQRVSSPMTQVRG